MEFINEMLSHAGDVVILIGCVYAVFKCSCEYLNIKSKNKLRDEYRESFNQTVSNLSSSNHSTQLASAISLRRYLTEKVKNIDESLTKETINVISSLVKNLPTGVFQKTLVDGLSYTKDLTECDLQKTNLQDALIGAKNYQLVMRKTDLFLADLSYANINNICAHEICLYNAILFCARVKNSDFTKANFRGADLSGIEFKDCTLTGADFTNAINIPPGIPLDNENKCTATEKISASHKSNGKNIFFSMPGIMSKNDEYITKVYKRILEARGFKVIYYTSDVYPRFGQLNKVRVDIMRSAGMVAFGLKQLNIQKASYRPNTADETIWHEKWLSTPWSEIEVGMGLMKGMPILLVCDPDICDGVFDNNLNECFVARISTAEDCRKLEQNKHFEEWISKLSC